MILEKSLLTELEKNKKRLKKKIKILRKAIIFWGRVCFGWVGRSTANQHFLRSAYFGCSSARFAQSIKKTPSISFSKKLAVV